MTASESSGTDSRNGAAWTGAGAPAALGVAAIVVLLIALQFYGGHISSLVNETGE